MEDEPYSNYVASCYPQKDVKNVLQDRTCRNQPQLMHEQDRRHGVPRYNLLQYDGK